jgi:hypothetical protein
VNPPEFPFSIGSHPKFQYHRLAFGLLVNIDRRLQSLLLEFMQSHSIIPSTSPADPR